MKRCNPQKIVLAWLFITMLVFPYVAKSVHTYHCLDITEICEHSDCNHEDENEGHDCEHCSLCKFLFCTFTLPEEIHVDCFINGIASLYFPATEEGYSCSLSSGYTRGPPTL